MSFEEVERFALPRLWMSGGVPPPGGTEIPFMKNAPAVSSPVIRNVISSPRPQ